MKKKIFIGFTEIAGYYQCVSIGLESLNYDITFVHNNSSPLNPNYYENKTTSFNKLFIFSQKRINRANYFASVLFFTIILEASKFVFFLFSLFKYQVYIFSYGNSFIRGGYDLLILQLLNKKIISNIAHGSESRPPYMDATYFREKSELSSLKLMIYTYLKSCKINRIERYSNYVIAAPYTSQFLRKEFISTKNIGVPIPFDKNIKYNQKKNTKIKIIHAPSFPLAKGTNHIRNAINSLRKKDFEFEYVELSGVKHKKVIEHIKEADLVVDQIYSDTFFAGLSSEAATYGVPSIVAGYELDIAHNFERNSLNPPVHSCKPSDIESAIEFLLKNPSYRKNLGKEAFKYIISNNNKNKIAECYDRLIRDDVPTSFYLNPLEISYFYGWGLSKEKIMKNLNKLVKKYGIKSLRISHNKLLLNKIKNALNIDS